MRRTGFAALVVLIAAVPAWARIDIIMAQVLDTDEVLINLASSEPDSVQAHAMDARVDNDANIIEVADNNSECMKYTHPAYVAWEAWGKPDCWCYRRQCRGDMNGESFFGKPVTLTDLQIFKSIPFGITDAELALIPNGICADLNHASFFGKRVTLSDLNILKTYFNQPDANVPDCDDTHYNYWIEP